MHKHAYTRENSCRRVVYCLGTTPAMLAVHGHADRIAESVFSKEYVHLEVQYYELSVRNAKRPTGRDEEEELGGAREKMEEEGKESVASKSFPVALDLHETCLGLWPPRLDSSTVTD
jgi:hypothetical protein